MENWCNVLLNHIRILLLFRQQVRAEFATRIGWQLSTAAPVEIGRMQLRSLRCSAGNWGGGFNSSLGNLCRRAATRPPSDLQTSNSSSANPIPIPLFPTCLFRQQVRTQLQSTLSAVRPPQPGTNATPLSLRALRSARNWGDGLIWSFETLASRAATAMRSDKSMRIYYY